MSNFQASIQKSSRIHDSRIVLALDYVNYNSRTLFNKSLKAITRLSPHLCAIKINRHLILSLGLIPKVVKLIEAAHRFELPVIIDCKINDIGNTNRVIAHQYLNIGFDALTANPFIGWKEGLEPVFELATKSNKGVILLVYMSHKGSEEGYGQQVLDPSTGHIRFQYQLFAEKAVDWGADGVVVGATYPSKIVEVNNILKKKIPIYSPGIGVQGGTIKTVVDAGASYLIIGRSIIFSSNPLATIKQVQQTLNRYL